MSNKPSKRERVWSILHAILIEGWHQGKLQSKTPYDYTLGSEEINEWMIDKENKILALFDETPYPELLESAVPKREV